MVPDLPAVPLVSRHLSASPERAFDAWLDPAVARRWLFATPGGEIVRCEIDARPGGAFTITDRRDGEDVAHVGICLEIDRPRRIVFRFSVPKYSNAESTVEVTVNPDGTGSDVILEYHGVPPEWARQTAEGWRDLLGKLEEVLLQGFGLRA
jgi:uncharacterized protein YndB with AHSA1/START domain